MLSTRSKGDANLAKFTDNPERIGKDKPRNKNKNMADIGTPDTNQQPDTGDKNQTPDPEENNDDKQKQNPMDKIYLPGLNNSPVNQALKNGLDYGMQDKVMIECQKLKQYFGVDTFLIQGTTGQICIYTRDEIKSFPIQCGRSFSS